MPHKKLLEGRLVGAMEGNEREHWREGVASREMSHLCHGDGDNDGRGGKVDGVGGRWAEGLGWRWRWAEGLRRRASRRIPSTFGLHRARPARLLKIEADRTGGVGLLCAGGRTALGLAPAAPLASGPPGGTVVEGLVSRGDHVSGGPLDGRASPGGRTDDGGGGSRRRTSRG